MKTFLQRSKKKHNAGCKDLARIINEQIQTENEKIIVNLDPNLFSKILIKLAKGHLCQAQDKVFEDYCSVVCNFKLKPDLSEDELYHFEELPLANKASECGSDFTHGLLIVEGIGMPSQIVVPWNEVQDGNYRYLTYFEQDNYIVRIVICETLFAELLLSESHSTEGI